MRLPAEGADFPKIDPDLVGVAKIKVAYNLVLLTEIPVVCMTCPFEAGEGADSPKVNPDPVAKIKVVYNLVLTRILVGCPLWHRCLEKGRYGRGGRKEEVKGRDEKGWRARKEG